MREGFKSIEHVKRYTTTGMGTDQGKLSNMHALGIIAEQLEQIWVLLAQQLLDLLTLLLPSVQLLEEMLENFFDHTRKTAMHNWHVQNKAKFENVGQWKRPGIIQKMVRQCLKQFKEKAKLLEKVLVY